MDHDRYLFMGYEGGGEGEKWSATGVDLMFAHQDELRAVAEVYASDEAGEKCVQDFAKARNKVVNLDRFDQPPRVDMHRSFCPR
ncbi:MAG: hypothetical protein ACUVRX_01305 [Actinomycetota bacterium]